MVYRGRGNPRARGYPRPFRSRGRGRRPFVHRGHNRGGFGPGDGGLRITLRNTDRGRRQGGGESYDRRSHDEREHDRRDDYNDCRSDFDQDNRSSHEFGEGGMFQDERESYHSHRDSPPRKRHHADSDFPEDESLRITVGNDMFAEEFSGQRDSPHTSNWDKADREREERWEEQHYGDSPHTSAWDKEDRKREDRWEEQRYGDAPHTSTWDKDKEREERWEEQHYDDRRQGEDRRPSRDDDYRDSSYDRDRGKWEDSRTPEFGKRGRGRGNYRARGRARGFDPNYRGKGRGRGDNRSGFRGRGWGNFEPHERGGRGFYKHFEGGRGQGAHNPHDQHSFEGNFDRKSLSPERRRSKSYSRSPDKRRSRSGSFRRRSRSRSRSRRSYSRGRRSFSRERSRSRGRRSRSWERRSPGRGRRSTSRGRRSTSRGRRSPSRGRSSRRRRSGSRRKRSRSGSRHSSSRSRSPAPVRRGPSRPKSMSRENRPKSMGREIGEVHTGERNISRASPPRSRSIGRSQSRGRDLRSHSRRRSCSSSSSSSSTADSKNHGSLPMSEQQYEEEMYRRLKLEITSNKDPKEREECIALHIREMAKLSPVLFRQFMAKNAGNLSAMAMMQPEQQEQHSVEHEPTEAEEETRPLRSILKRKGDSRSPSPARNPSPPPEEPRSKALSQIEKVIQALRKGGSRPEEPKPQREKTPSPPPPPPIGALKQLSSYMDVDEEEEYLYGDDVETATAEPKAEALSGPFWSAHRFEDRQQSDLFDVYGAQQEPLPSTKPLSQGLYEDRASTSHKEEIKIPSAFSSFEDKEKSYEQWRASVFQKPAPEKPKEAPLPQSSGPVTSESAEQLNSTVENILKSIGFNFELSQRMQELARQKKEEEQDAIQIDQSASFLGAEDALAEDLSNVFQREDPPNPELDFMLEIEAATKAAREKALKAKEAEERHIRGMRNPSFEENNLRERDRNFPSHRSSGGHTEGNGIMNVMKKLRKSSDTSRSDIDHSPYDPNVQDYHHHGSHPPEQQYQGSSGFFQEAHHQGPIRSANLISLGGESREHERSGLRREENDLSLSKRFSDPPLHDYDSEDVSYKKAGERILIVRKNEEKGRIDSPGSENSFSRRIVLPPKEKPKPPQMKSPSSDSLREGKRRAASPDSPRQSKHSRRSSPIEDRSERKDFQKSTKLEDKKAQERCRSPEKSRFDSKFKYQASEKRGKNDSKAKSEGPRIGGISKLDSLKAKVKEELPKIDSKSELVKAAIKAAEEKAQEKKRQSGFKSESLAAARDAAEEKAHFMERKRQLLALERELEALRRQHNELLRKRRRQKDGHKDPLIVENTKLQTEIVAQIKSLRRGSDSGSSGSKSSAAASSSSSFKDGSSKAADEGKSKGKVEPKIRYEYFDPGSHWCSTCNVVCGHMFDFFRHVESKKHQQKMDPFNRPWLVEAMQKQEKKPKPEGQVQAAPIKGLEFMMATSAFYCSLCKEFCGDLSIAETHMKSEEHHHKYKDYLSQHPYYEKRYMLERSAALSMQKQVKEDEENDSDSDKQKSEDSKEKASTKSDSDNKNSSKAKDDKWKEKIFGKKTLYSDYEEEYSTKFESRDRDRDKRRYRGRSRERSRERSDNSKDHRDSRDRRGDSKERKDSKDHRERKEDEKSSTSKPNKKETLTTSKDAESKQTEEKRVEPSDSVDDQNVIEESTGEETKKDPDVSMEAEDMADESKTDEVKSNEETKTDEEAKKEQEAEAKGKIPIKLTGKSGIKPAASVPPWKMFTRPIPKSSAQKRLLGPRRQAATVASSSGIGPAIPNEDPAPLADFLTVGVKKTVPVVPDEVIEQPPDPKTLRKENKVALSAEKLEEMKILGIDPSSLVPDVKPKPPPPPSQNLSLPLARNTGGAELAKTESGTSGPANTNVAGSASDQSQKQGQDLHVNSNIITSSTGVEGRAGLFSMPSAPNVTPFPPPPPLGPVVRPAGPPRGFGRRPPLLSNPNTPMPLPGYMPSMASFAPRYMSRPAPMNMPPPFVMQATPPILPIPPMPVCVALPPAPPPPPPPPLPEGPAPIPPPPPSPPKPEDSSVSDGDAGLPGIESASADEVIKSSDRQPSETPPTSNEAEKPDVSDSAPATDKTLTEEAPQTTASNISLPEQVTSATTLTLASQVTTTPSLPQEVTPITIPSPEQVTSATALTLTSQVTTSSSLPQEVAPVTIPSPEQVTVTTTQVTATTALPDQVTAASQLPEEVTNTTTTQVTATTALPDQVTAASPLPEEVTNATTTQVTATTALPDQVTTTSSLPEEVANTTAPQLSELVTATLATSPLPLQSTATATPPFPEQVTVTIATPPLPEQVIATTPSLSDDVTATTPPLSQQVSATKVTTPLPEHVTDTAPLPEPVTAITTPSLSQQVSATTVAAPLPEQVTNTALLPEPVTATTTASLSQQVSATTVAKPLPEQVMDTAPLPEPVTATTTPSLSQQVSATTVAKPLPEQVTDTAPLPEPVTATATPPLTQLVTTTTSFPEQVTAPSLPKQVMGTTMLQVTAATTPSLPLQTAAPASPSLQSEVDVEGSQVEFQSSSAVALTVQITDVGVAEESSDIVAKPSTSSAEETPASTVSESAPQVTLEVEPQPSTSAPEVAASDESTEPTSTLSVTFPVKRNVARRGRGARRAVPVQSMPAEESVEPEGSDAPAAASRRPRTRSQMRPVPQRQTRSRTRQQKIEEEEDSVTASDETVVHKCEGEVGSSTAREAESPDGSKASSTSACVLDLTNPPADSSGGSEANTEVTSSSTAVKSVTVVEPPSVDSALNLTIPPEIRGARQGRLEQTMPEDLSCAEPQDLSTSSSGKGKGRRPPEMPIDLTMRLVPTQSVDLSLPEEPQPMETQPSTSCPSSSSESVLNADCLDPQTMKDTLLSSTSAMNPSTSNLSELEVGEEGDMVVDASSQMADSAGLGVDPEGELVDFSLAPVDFEELVDMEVEDSNAGQPEAGDAEDSGGAADSTFSQN